MIKELISNNVIWLVLMVVNLLLSNLTLVLPSKYVMRVNYRVYLQDTYKIKGISYTHLKTVLSMMNIIGLLWLVMPNEIVKSIYFFVLIVVSIFHITNTIRYDLLLNGKVKKDIYMSEFSGLYYAYDNNRTMYTDMSVKNAIRSEKELSNNVVNYFNSYNRESIKTFKEIFGPTSFLYENSETYKKYCKKHYDNKPCEYRSKSGVIYMPYEFIELFQNTRYQNEWSIELLKLLNTDDKTIDNLVLLLATVRVMGRQQKLFSVDFLLTIKPYIMDIAYENIIKIKIPSRIVRENKLLRELQLYIQMTLNLDTSIVFYRESIGIYKTFFNVHGYMSHQECMSFVNYLLDQSTVLEEGRNKKFLLEFCDDYIKKNSCKEKNEQVNDIESQIITALSV